MTLKEVYPNFVHRTKKLSFSLVLSYISSGCSSKHNDPIDVIIAGDLAGDVITFPVTGKVETLSRHFSQHFSEESIRSIIIFIPHYMVTYEL